MFNHKQTKELLSKGFTNGRANAQGTAYASGGIVGNITDINRPSKDTDDDSFSEIFDHVEILLDRLDRNISNLTDSIDDYSENLSKQQSVSQQAINATKNGLTTLQNSYDTYMAQANAVGLEGNWQSVVQNGELRISEITDEDLKQRIEDYKTYYEKALDAQDKIAQYQRDLLQLAQQKLSNIETYYENRSQYNEDYGIETNISELKTALSSYEKELNAQVSSGAIKQYSSAWYSSMTKIADYMQTIFEKTWERIQNAVEGLGRNKTTLNNVLDLKEARGEKITESDYNDIINNNNQQVNGLYSQRQGYLDQMRYYDVNSAKYQELASKVSDCDDEIYSLWMDNESLKDSIREVRWDSFNKGIDTIENTIDELEWLRSNLNDSFDSDGNITADGLTNINLIGQGMTQQKQLISDYREALKKLDEEYANGVITQDEYTETSRDYQSAIRDASDAVEDYKDELIDLYSTQMKGENDALQELIDKRKEALDKKKEYYDYDKTIKSKSKDINAIKAQISALSGATDASSKAELAKLQAQLKEQEDDLADTKYEHAITLRQDGYDALADKAQTVLDDTLDALNTNSELQQQVVNSMLSSIVGSYSDAYSKIQSIISSTGAVLSGDASSSITNASSNSGANSLVDTAINGVGADSNSSSISSGSINTSSGTTVNQGTMEDTLAQGIDESNRKVAKITLTANKTSMYVGESASISVAYTPNDAKTKSVKWVSSNTSVATVSGGSVKGIKAGSATITAVCTDGGGASASVGFSIQNKPVPAPAPKPSNNGGGDGVPRVGDEVTYNSGNYYYSSQGTRPLGYQHRGEKVHITSINTASWATKPYHISTGSRLGSGDLGWLNLDQISGYAKGTQNATNGWHEIDEKGTELAMRYVNYNGKNYTKLTAGDGVVPADMSDVLFAFAKNPSEFLSDNMPNTSAIVTNNNGMSISISYDNMINIEGNADGGTAKAIQDAIPDITKQISTQLTKEMRKLGYKK